MNQVTYYVPLKTTGTAYLWWFFLGGFGAHKFYLGRPGMGLLYAFTFGLLWIGVLVDLFTLPAQVRHANELLMGGGASKNPGPGFASGERSAAASTDFARADELIAAYKFKQETSAAAPAVAVARSFGRRMNS